MTKWVPLGALAYADLSSLLKRSGRQGTSTPLFLPLFLT